MSSQLWQLLIKVDQLAPGEQLTCLDCFAIMDLLLLAAELSLDFEQLQQMARNHLAHCPGCREQLRERLNQLEESGDRRPRSTTTNQDAPQLAAN